MFASRANQENAIYNQQTAAAAKPLNQGVKGLAPKTPGGKAPRNDENAIFGAGKTGGKGVLLEGGKGGKLDKSAFVTPAGAKTRAPLGNKTTNVKAAHFQTPAPPAQDKQSAKHTSPRLRRAKIKVHEAEPATAENGVEEREIEYMPPRETPLPDHPDDCWPIDRTYPQFEGKNLTRGWWGAFSQPVDEDEDTEFSDFEEKLKRVEQREKKAGGAPTAKKGTPVKKEAGLQAVKRDPLSERAPQTVRAKSAASALARTSKPPTTTASLAAPKARPMSNLLSKKTAAQPTAPGNTRHTAAKVASNSTLGYSKGRAVSGAARRPLAQLQGKQVFAPTAKARAASPQKKMLGAAALDELFGMPDLDIASDEDDGLGGRVTGGFGDEEDELDGFQLDAVEL